MFYDTQRRAEACRIAPYPSECHRKATCMASLLSCASVLLLMSHFFFNPLDLVSNRKEGKCVQEKDDSLPARMRAITLNIFRGEFRGIRRIMHRGEEGGSRERARDDGLH